jgi:antitoxin component of MazEF toxin-antitoxin module
VAKQNISITTVSRAGRGRASAHLKTYIPAKIARQLQLQHGDLLGWILQGKKITIKKVSQYVE